MLSEEQNRKIEMNILKVTSVFLETGGFIDEVAQKTNIPKSSVQRYLNDSKRIIKLLGEEVNNEIKSILRMNKQQGNQNGGLQFRNNNITLKDELGKFVGSRKK